MARPHKQNLDFYKHEVQMRNDIKLKAVRAKFGNNGYAVFNMLLEVLSESDCLQLPYDDDQLELLAPDFMIEKDLLREMIEYFCKPRIELFQIEDGFLRCEQLDKRAQELFSTRKVSLEKIRSVSLGLSGEKTTREPTREPQENAHSRVEKSRVEKSREKTPPACVREIVHKLSTSYPPNGSTVDPNVEKQILALSSAGEDLETIITRAGEYAEYWKWRLGNRYPYGRHVAQAANWLEKKMYATDWAKKLEAERADSIINHRSKTAEREFSEPIRELPRI